MNSLPLVSIVTIVYNGEEFVEQTIKSVLAQTYPYIEYIIIDGGSKDGTVEIIKKYNNHLAYWVSEPDKGISDAFNKGIQRATGEIVGLINADDWYHPQAVEKVVAQMGTNDVVYGDLAMIKQGQVDFTLIGNHQMLMDSMTVNHPTVFARKSLYAKWGTYNIKYKCAMDYDVMLRFRINGASFVRIPSILAYMRWEGMSDNNWYKGCVETLHIKNSLLPGRRISNRVFFIRHVAGILAPRLLDRIGLRTFVKWYRKRFAAQKKQY
ncbi:MAG: glycosyltransferase family 2 protein [Chitinophagaceae bacterium]